MMMICRAMVIAAAARAARVLKQVAVAYACVFCLSLSVNAQAGEVTLVRATDFVREELKFEMSVTPPFTLARNGKFSDELGRTYGWFKWTQGFGKPDEASPAAATRCDSMLGEKESVYGLTEKKLSERTCSLSFKARSKAEYVVMQAVLLPSERCPPSPCFLCFLEVEIVADSAAAAKGLRDYLSWQLVNISGNPSLSKMDRFEKPGVRSLEQEFNELFKDLCPGEAMNDNP